MRIQIVPDVSLDRFGHVSRVQLLDIDHHPFCQKDEEERPPDEGEGTDPMSLQERLKPDQPLSQYGHNRIRKADSRPSALCGKQTVEDRLERTDRDRIKYGDEDQGGDGKDDPCPVRSGVPEHTKELLQRRLHGMSVDVRLDRPLNLEQLLQKPRKRVKPEHTPAVTRRIGWIGMNLHEESVNPCRYGGSRDVGDELRLPGRGVTRAARQLYAVSNIE